jgi:hypothetical protein
MTGHAQDVRRRIESGDERLSGYCQAERPPVRLLRIRLAPSAAVMAGLDPAIQAGCFKVGAAFAKRTSRRRRLDGRVKPGHDADTAENNRLRRAFRDIVGQFAVSDSPTHLALGST